MRYNNFEVLRGGVNSTFQDKGFFNVQHLGITTGGAADINLFTLANKILNNKENTAALEFLLQGPLLRLKKGKCRFVITGDVKFQIITKEKIINGIPNNSYLIEEGNLIDILTTKKSNYGYLAVEGGFKLSKQYECFSTLTQSKIGANNGQKLKETQLIYFNKNGSKVYSFLDSNNFFLNRNVIRVLKGPQMNFFMQKIIRKFFSESFVISNSSNRIGIRLEGSTINSIKSHDIASEGIIKGSIQVPGSGNPIIVMTDHPTTGGYPKIATVILADIPKVAQLPFGQKIIFEEVSLADAEKIYKKENKSFKSLLDKISHQNE